MRDTVIFDLDGTLSIVGDRLKYIQGPEKNWAAFFEACDRDEPNEPIIDLMAAIYCRYEKVGIITGRSDLVREKTEIWLHHYGVDHDFLLMRKDGDHRPDREVKLEFLEEIGGPERIAFAVDDQEHMAKFWEEHRIPCLHFRSSR